MRILQLTKKFPYPPKDGESVAILTMAQAYNALGCDVDLLALNTKKHRVDDWQNLAVAYYDNISAIPIDTSISYVKALVNLFSSESYNVQRFISSAFVNKLKELLDENVYDFIQLETLYMTPYIKSIRQLTKTKIVFRSHNLEYEIWKEMAKTSSNPLKRIYYKHASKNLKKYELNVLSTSDLLAAISHSDYAKYVDLGYNGVGVIAEVGLDLHEYQFEPAVLSDKEIRLGYIGSLDWRPNIEGLTWFFKNIWNKAHKTEYSFIFHLAGRNASDDFKGIIPENTVFHGEVDDAHTFISDIDIVVVPLLSGSGIRVKILESMAMGKIVFSTNKGFEGIDIKDGVNAFVFNDDQSFYSKLNLVIRDPEKMKTISQNARHTIEAQFNYKSIAQKILDNI